MKNGELILLENIIDSLDRLFDGESHIVDIYVLLFATSKALSETNHFQIIDKSANNLRATINSIMSKDESRTAALVDTDELRHYIAELLPPFVNYE